MARRYRKKARHSKAKPSIVSMLPLAVIGMKAYDGYKAGGAAGAVIRPVRELTGIALDGAPWRADFAMQGAGLLVGTMAAKKLVAWSGVNKAMKGLPIRL